MKFLLFFIVGGSIDDWSNWERNKLPTQADIDEARQSLSSTIRLFEAKVPRVRLPMTLKPSVKVTAKLNTEITVRCPMCMDDIDGLQLFCPHLGSLVHESCMTEFGRCGCHSVELLNKKLIIDLGTIVSRDEKLQRASHSWPFYFMSFKWATICAFSPSYWFTGVLAVCEITEYLYRKRS
tara:strand:- start:43 stop:582 length:540 start_codon:yes stop_codon:yes gene_type:complete